MKEMGRVERAIVSDPSRTLHGRDAWAVDSDLVKEKTRCAHLHDWQGP